MKESNTKQIKNLFFRLLQDGGDHTTNEIYNLICASPNIHLINSNTIYSTLCKIRKSSYSQYFVRNRDGSYRLKAYLLKPESKALLQQLTNEDTACLENTLTVDEVIQLWLSLYLEIESELKQIEESTEYQKIRQLNDSLYKLINEHLNKNDIEKDTN